MFTKLKIFLIKKTPHKARTSPLKMFPLPPFLKASQSEANTFSVVIDHNKSLISWSVAKRLYSDRINLWMNLTVH